MHHPELIILPCFDQILFRLRSALRLHWVFHSTTQIAHIERLLLHDIPCLGYIEARSKHFCTDAMNPAQVPTVVLEARNGLGQGCAIVIGLQTTGGAATGFA